MFIDKRGVGHLPPLEMRNAALSAVFFSFSWSKATFSIINKQVRIVWDDEQQKYYFSVTDVVGVLTEQPDARGASTYWAVLKKRLLKEGAVELLTNCKQLKLPPA